jgi:hypothetical protein
VSLEANAHAGQTAPEDSCVAPFHPRKSRKSFSSPHTHSSWLCRLFQLPRPSTPQFHTLPPQHSAPTSGVGSRRRERRRPAMGCCVSCEKGAVGEGEGERKKDPAEKQSQIAPTGSPSGHMRPNLLHSRSSCSRSHSR